MKPLQVGITGGIGAGKTIIARIFSLLGIPVYDADSSAKWLMTNDKSLIEEITHLFGKEAYFPDGSLNREFIATQAFLEKDHIKSLNSIVHPAVRKHYHKWVESNTESPYLLKEAAILFESNAHKELDKVITVSAPAEVRIERTLARDAKRSKEQVLAIMEKQMPEEEKILLADYVIYNDDTQLIIPQILAVDSDLRDCKIPSI